MMLTVNENLKAGERSTIHKFELAGLGKAPFHFTGQVSEKTYQACNGAPVQPASTCDYCGTAGGELIVRTRPEPKKRQDSFRRYLAKVWVAGVPQELGEFLLSQHHATIWTKGGDK